MPDVIEDIEDQQKQKQPTHKNLIFFNEKMLDRRLA